MGVMRFLIHPAAHPEGWPEVYRAYLAGMDGRVYPTRVEVDAFPGEHFMGRIARVSPVLDPATRTAPIEIEIPNSGFRLKPGMYARVSILTGSKKDALVVPSNAVVDLGGRRGVFIHTSQPWYIRRATTMS